jgi:single-strand selective monofunctional uracil DNA glycosylase
LTNNAGPCTGDGAKDNGLLAIADDLSARVGDLRFRRPVACVYNPLEYARAGFRAYVTRYGAPPKELLILGMNPGPWGMAQTGVPFGEVAHVRSWLDIDEPVGHPVGEIPSRPIMGFACTRSEVSGARVWGWARAAFGTPERFFARCFVTNYCPLIFFDAAGHNLTPDRLARADQVELFAICDNAFRRTALLVEARQVIALGVFAFVRAQEALAGTGCTVTAVPHPSPANPAANRGWSRLMTAAVPGWIPPR